MGCSGSKKVHTGRSRPANSKDESPEKLKWQGAMLVQQAQNRMRALQDVQGTNEMTIHSRINLRCDASEASYPPFNRTHPDTWLLSHSELDLVAPSAPSSCVVFIPGDYEATC
eukprot:TRINITY_DN12856_c0_g1_i1.p1 TRINITY_DN12856_c0_g1~~TRINITY_DN12856_c0_g1_i1.p1  ORF type:complete len:131 (+),score=5.73 TRINITY_DN12856_c0_g1_i1:56-394(+)